MPEYRRKLVTLPTLGKTSINFYCSACNVLELYDKTDEFNRQKEIKQLGLISTVFEGASHSRYEYLMLQCGIVDVIDKIHKGTPSIALGEINVDGKTYSGNNLLKSWFMLSNFGHTKNTIGDEKSLLLYSLSNADFLKTLLKPIKDQSLCSWCLEVINTFEYTKFHHILSIRRIYKELGHQVSLLNEIIKIYKLLLDYDLFLSIKYIFNTNKLRQLRRIFDTVRLLSIVNIDGYYSHSPISVDLISIILSLDTIENNYSGVYVFDSLKPLISMFHDEIYLDRNVLACQRDYEIKSLQYLYSEPRNYKSYEKSINRSLRNGLVGVSEVNYAHLYRMKICNSSQPKSGFYNHLMSITKIESLCSNVCVSLDVNPVTGIRYADFYYDNRLFSNKDLPGFVWHISNILKDQYELLSSHKLSHVKDFGDEIRSNALSCGIDSHAIESVINQSNRTASDVLWTEYKNEILPLFKDLLWGVLSLFFKPNLRMDVKEFPKTYDAFCMKLPSGHTTVFDRFVSNIDFAIEEEFHDNDRVHELKQVRQSACRKFEGYVFVCLSRIVIYDQSLPPSKTIKTDIDSVVVKFSNSTAYIELHESKNTSHPERDAVKDLNKMLVPLLSRFTLGYRIVKVKNYGAKLIIKCN